jgi:outer membrane protein assembly factor BamE (lipoprotein component of BamABCDE complex)
MKKGIILLALVGMFVAGCGTHMKERAQAKWQVPDNWESLEKGMSKAQVRARLGRPPLEGDFDITGHENWYYPDPQGGIVQLDPDGKVTGFVTPWQKKSSHLVQD